MELKPQPFTGDEADDLEPVISVARAAVDHQSQIPERLESKARGQLTIAGAWFAVVQAVAAKAFDIDGLANAWIWVIGGLAALGGIALLVTAWLAAQVWRLRPGGEIDPDSLILMANEIRHQPEIDVQGRLVSHYADVLDDRMTSNSERARWFEKAQLTWYLAMFVPLLELGVSFVAQALG
jgi:hypothetical protein